jgi:hypothetical protein
MQVRRWGFLVVMPSLYVLGGRQRKLLLKQEEEWNLYDCALILKIDTTTGAVETCLEYTTPQTARPHERSSSVFKSGTLVGDTLYACTATELLIFKRPEFRLLDYISLPCFNDVHHVLPSRDGTLLAVATGLDMVVRLSDRGKLIEEWSALAEAPWARFSRDLDYRKVETTKPHLSHPNFVFELNDEVWVTRFIQRDAICLTRSSGRIDIGLETPHDGLVRDGKIYFTLVDGRLVVVDADTLRIDTCVDFKTCDDTNALLGWCRGVLPVDDAKLWIGFTRIRKTRIHENLLWVKHVFKEGMLEKPTHISLYDIENCRLLEEFNLEPYGMNIIFSIFPAPD